MKKQKASLTSHFLCFHYYEDVIEHTEVLYEASLNFLLY